MQLFRLELGCVRAYQCYSQEAALQRCLGLYPSYHFSYGLVAQVKPLTVSWSSTVNLRGTVRHKFPERVSEVDAVGFNTLSLVTRA